MLAAVLCLGMCLVLGSCRKEAEEEYDPYEGMVQVRDGMGGEMWVKLLESLPVSVFSQEDFSAADGFVSYTGSDFIAHRGIDVSEHQYDIDWDSVAASGVEFAVIRAGYRGYSQGGLNEDPYYRYNISEAKRTGIKVGVYFFSQALDTNEAIEEANFLLGLLEGYSIDLPVFFDWEPIHGVEDVRTEGVSGDVVTECCLAFAQTIESAGYTPGVYFYRSQGYFDYDLERLSKLMFWSAAIGDYPDFYYDHRFWQYSYTGAVPGIEEGVDLDLMFERVQQPGNDAGETE